MSSETQTHYSLWNVHHMYQKTVHEGNTCHFICTDISQLSQQ